MSRAPCLFSIALLVLTAVSRPSGITPQEGRPVEKAPDVIVVGAGIAGLTAALESARGGATVTVIDMWSIFGGHAVMSEGGLCLVDTPVQRAQGITDSPDLAYRDFIEWGEDADAAWVRYYVDHARTDIYDWITPLGVEFDQVRQLPGNSVARFHRTRGRGLALVSPIYRECVEQPRIRFIWNTKVIGLVQEHGRVVGVRGQDLRAGTTAEYRSAAVLLATGGFQSNLEMVREFWPREMPFPEGMLVGSGVNSVGSGHAVARQAGAALVKMDHQWNYATGLPDPRDRSHRRGLNASNPSAIWVNAEGRRFVNEEAGTKVTFPALLAQKPPTYWAIFDDQGKKTFSVSGSDWGDFAEMERRIFQNETLVRSASSLVELARVVGLPTGALEATVQRFNGMIDAGVDREFGRFKQTSEAPPRIEQPPFYAVQFFPLTRKSMGGVAIDRDCRVVDEQGRAIPGLYAAGELTGLAGINGKAGLEGTFLGPSILTGRVAARTMLAALDRRAPPADTYAETLRLPATTRRVGVGGGCLGCHDLAAEVATPRKGFVHFEKVHRKVLDRKSDCSECHAMEMPFDPTNHEIDRLQQIESCRLCHVAEAR